MFPVCFILKREGAGFGEGGACTGALDMGGCEIQSMGF